jgi:prevent-host-death family protein
MKLKSIALRDAKAELSAVVDDSQRDRIVITRHGRPAAVVIGVEGFDFDDLMLSLDADLWQTMVERRQKEPRGVPFEQVLRRYREP